MPPRRNQRWRETKGLGSVFDSPKGSGRWFFRPPPVNKVQQPAIRAESEEAARTLQRQFRRDREDGIQGGRAHTVRTWMPVYFQAASDQDTAKDSTIEGYEQKDRLYISAHLGDILISDLTTARVRQWFARDLVGKSGKLLSFTTRKNSFALLSAALNLAVTEALIRKNPCDGVKIVRPESEEEYRGHALDPGACERLLATARGRWLYGLIYTALVERDPDRPAPAHPGGRAVQSDPQGGALAKTKNRKQREIDIDDELLAVLSAQRELIQQCRNDSEAAWFAVDYDLVFPSEVGTPLIDRNLVRSYKALLKRATLPNITFHDLRHSAGSLMLLAGARITEVSEVLGHSSVKVTQDIYAHAFPETRREAVTGLSRLLKRGAQGDSAA